MAEPEANIETKPVSPPPKEKPDIYAFILAKAPIPTHDREGAVEDQDWMQPLYGAVELLKSNSNAKILLVSGFTTIERGKMTREVDHYLETLRVIGVDAARIDYIDEGNETIRQLHLAHQQALKANRRLIILCTPLHYYRVTYLCKKDHIAGTVLMVPNCIPRQSEAMRDMLLTLIFPWIDRLGLRNLYLWYVNRRRDSGTL